MIRFFGYEKLFPSYLQKISLSIARPFFCTLQIETILLFF